jgi:hypothetical protein
MDVVHHRPSFLAQPDVMRHKRSEVYGHVLWNSFISNRDYLLGLIDGQLFMLE